MLVVRGPVRSGLSCEKATKKRSVCACVCWLEGYDVVAHQSSPNGRHVAPIMRVLVLGERDGKRSSAFWPKLRKSYEKEKCVCVRVLPTTVK